MPWIEGHPTHFTPLRLRQARSRFLTSSASQKGQVASPPHPHREDPPRFSLDSFSQVCRPLPEMHGRGPRALRPGWMLSGPGPGRSTGEWMPGTAVVSMGLLLEIEAAPDGGKGS